MMWVIGGLIALATVDIIDRVGPSRIGYAAAFVASRAVWGMERIWARCPWTNGDPR